jgi:hypothetical protein
VNSINHDSNTQFYVNNSTNFLSCNFMGWSASNYAEVELDGWTKPLKAVANVQPCQKYHIKLVIADVGDGLYDSAVFLKANSFSAGGQVAAAPAYATNRPVASEGCVGGAIRFFRAGSTTNPLTVNYAVSPASTAAAGTDYAPLPGVAVIPAGESEVLVPVTIFSDGLSEGIEKIVLDISNSCQCETNQIEFLIGDSEPLSLALSGDSLICEFGESSLAALATGGGPQCRNTAGIAWLQPADCYLAGTGPDCQRRTRACGTGWCINRDLSGEIALPYKGDAEEQSAPPV